MVPDGAGEVFGAVEAEGAAVPAAGASAFADCPKIFDMISPKIPMIHSLLDFDILK
jgi:hypothetical protein